MTKSPAFIKLCKKHEVDPDLIPEITTFEQACKARKVNPKKLPVVTGIPYGHRKRIIADYKLTIIAEALREGKNVDYADRNQWKYFPWFEVKADKKRPSGFGLSCNDYDCWDAYSFVGVRLSFPNRDLAKYFGKQFLKLHVDHHLLT